jgi:hypothetical protein
VLVPTASSGHAAVPPFVSLVKCGYGNPRLPGQRSPSGALKADVPGLDQKRSRREAVRPARSPTKPPTSGIGPTSRRARPKDRTEITNGFARRKPAVSTCPIEAMLEGWLVSRTSHLPSPSPYRTDSGNVRRGELRGIQARPTGSMLRHHQPRPNANGDHLAEGCGMSHAGAGGRLPSHKCR